MAPAPGLLSTTNICPSMGPIVSAAARDKVSLLAPGANGTTSRIALLGYAGVWLDASAVTNTPSASTLRSNRVFIGVRHSSYGKTRAAYQQSISARNSERLMRDGSS